MVEKRGLGKGLDLLLPDTRADRMIKTDIVQMRLDRIHSNAAQPRQNFTPQALEELSLSVRENGVLQPILVRSHKEKKGEYEIIAGERRWRAARQAGLESIPVLIRELDDEQTLAVALIENLQREDLNPIEEALALQTLRERFAINQEALAKKVGKSRSAIANSIRLLQLPEKVLDEVKEGRISSGHARSLLALENEEMQIQVCDEIIQKDYNVRQTEKLVAEFKQKKIISSNAKKSSIKEPSVFQTELLEKLQSWLPCSVQIKGTAEKGSIHLQYSSADELERLQQFLFTQKDKALLSVE